MSELLEGLSYLGNGGYWAAFGVAVFMAVFVGLLPGVSATLVMALSISFIVLNIEDPLIGIVMLATLTGVDNTLDSIPAVLLGHSWKGISWPGEGWPRTRWERSTRSLQWAVSSELWRSLSSFR